MPTARWTCPRRTWRCSAPDAQVSACAAAAGGDGARFHFHADLAVFRIDDDRRAVLTVDAGQYRFAKVVDIRVGVALQSTLLIGNLGELAGRAPAAVVLYGAGAIALGLYLLPRGQDPAFGQGVWKLRPGARTRNMFRWRLRITVAVSRSRI